MESLTESQDEKKNDGRKRDGVGLESGEAKNGGSSKLGGISRESLSTSAR